MCNLRSPCSGSSLSNDLRTLCFFPQALDCGSSNSRLRTQRGVAGREFQNPAAGGCHGAGETVARTVARQFW